MITALIIDDELKSRETLHSLISEYCYDIEVKDLCGSVDSAILAIHKYRPDVIFLDIEMNKETGFDLLDKLKGMDFQVIFTTAYENYALKAIKFCAIDYLLKPIDITELRSAISKLEKKIDKDLFNEQFKIYMHNLHHTNISEQRIAIPATDGLVFLNLPDIIRLEADGAYTNFFLKNRQKIITSKNLKEYEDLLCEHNFFRVHNSHLINLSEVTKYVRGEGGYVIMSDNFIVDVSRRKKDAFLSQISRL